MALHQNQIQEKKKTVRWGSAVTLCIHVCSFFSKQKWNAPLWFLSLVSEKERLCNRKWGWRWQKHTGSEVRPDLVTSLTLTFSIGCLSNQCSRWDSFKFVEKDWVSHMQPQTDVSYYNSWPFVIMLLFFLFDIFNPFLLELGHNSILFFKIRFKHYCNKLMQCIFLGQSSLTASKV